MFAEKDAKISLTSVENVNFIEMSLIGVLLRSQWFVSTFRSVVIPRSLQASLPQCRKNSEKYAASLTQGRTFLKRLSDFIGRLTSSLYAATYYREFISSACCVFVNKLILPKAADLLGGPYFVKKVFKKSGLFKIGVCYWWNVPFPD